VKNSGRGVCPDCCYGLMPASSIAHSPANSSKTRKRYGLGGGAMTELLGYYCGPISAKTGDGDLEPMDCLGPGRLLDEI
jgi:hypothetical protein